MTDGLYNRLESKLNSPDSESHSMDQSFQKRTSRFLSLVLRHQPDKIGIELDESGWVEIEILLNALNRNGHELSRSQLRMIVDQNDKQRFAFSKDGLRIRANQGHSVEIELRHPAAEPPEFLLHGTPEKSVESIRESGLEKAKRHDVHLHEDLSVAKDVGTRRGKPVILRIRSGEMQRAGHTFYLTPNNVWLVDSVPAEFIDFP